jgi:hypothetical protein
MSPIEQKLSEQFYQWELRGRGIEVFPKPVSPEPPFRPFCGHFVPFENIPDDGRRTTFLSSLVEKLSRKLSTAPPEMPSPSPPEEEPEPELLFRERLIELQTTLPADLDSAKDAFEHFLHNLSLCREPVAFELLGLPQSVTAQFASHPGDASLVQRQLEAHFPEALFQPRDSTLETAWDAAEGDDALVVEFGLAREFMYSLSCGKFDPFVGIVGAMSALQGGELALFQVIWQRVQHPWAQSIVNSVTGADGRPFFVNCPELANAAEEKVSHPLFAAVIRIAVKSERHERTLQIARDIAASLAVFGNPSGNEIIPLSNEDYPFEDHIEDTLRRQTRRSGMILTSEELIGFVHMPGSAVRTAAFKRQVGKTRTAPAIVRHSEGLLLGEKDHAGQLVFVRLSPDQRVRHMHVLGASGTGKSTLLFNLIAQDIQNGEGVAVLDPHGDLIDKILGVIPDERIDDVVLVDPSDPEYSVGFNILSAHSDLEKNLLASDLVSVFQRLSTSWGDQMNSVLQNAILAFLESSRGGTIADLRRFLIEPAFRNEFLKSVKDSEVVYYWQKSFPHLSGGKSIGSILTRIDALLAKKPIRHMVSQAENRLDFAHIMDTGKIFLAKLPEGLLGKENSYLLGALLVSKFQQIAMARQAQQIESRRLFSIVIDEFANFITPTMAEILSGARKYRIALTLAHHELHQLQRNPDVASAVMSHPYTRIIFRVGDDDARKLADGLSHFDASDIRNLDTGHAIVRVERSDYDFNLTVPLPVEVDKVDTKARRDGVITASRIKYSTPRAQIEATLLAKLHTEAPPERSRTAPAVSEVPKRPDIPKASESPPAALRHALQKNISAEPAPVVEALKPLPPSDKGIGGHQHNLIRERIESVASELGYTPSRETRTDAGGKIDVVLKKPNRAIACEIAITTTIDHEVGNVAKCLNAGFDAVAVISPSADRLDKIKAGVMASLASAETVGVAYYHPDAFIEHLRKSSFEASPSAPPTPGVTTFGKYKVKHSMVNLTPEERKEREAAAIRMLAETMRKKK